VTAWAQRSRIQAVYLNPAAIAAVIAAAASGYESAANDRAMAWPISFVVSPLVLHLPTREALPSTTATHVTAWISRNPILRAGFPARARSLAPLVYEGLRFGLRHGLLTIAGDAVHGQIRRSSDNELASLLRQATFVGRWLAKTDQPATIFAIFGVEP